MKAFAKVAIDGWNLITQDGRLLCKFDNLDQAKAYCRDREYDFDIYRSIEVSAEKRPTRLCSIAECREPVYGRMLCRHHYTTLWVPTKQPYVQPGCEKRAYKAGLCSSHYKQHRMSKKRASAYMHEYDE